MKALNYYKYSLFYPTGIGMIFLTLPFLIPSDQPVDTPAASFAEPLFYTSFIVLIGAIPYLITSIIIFMLYYRKSLKIIKQYLIKAPFILLLVETLIFSFLYDDGKLFSNGYFGFIGFVAFNTLAIGYAWIGIVFFIGNKIEKREQITNGE